MCFAALVVAVVAAGCGGGENPSVTTPTYQFAGAWSGDWFSPEMEQGGTTSVVVDAEGDVFGTLNNVVLEEDADLDGHITPQGIVTGTVTYPNDETYVVTGEVLVDGEGHLVGVLHQAVGNTTVDIEVDLARVEN
jgi:hypothetical protein